MTLTLFRDNAYLKDCEAEIVAGVRLAAERSRLVAEPSGALVVAAMAYHSAEVGIAPPGVGGRLAGRRHVRSQSTAAR